MANLWIKQTKIKKIDIINVKFGLTAKEVRDKYRPDYFINLAMYDTTSGLNITRLEDENVKFGYLFADVGIGIMGDKDLIWTDYKTAYADRIVRDFVSGSPPLVIDNIIVNTKDKKVWGNKYSAYVDKIHYRSFVGFNKKYLILCASDNPMSLPATAYTARYNLHCRYALNLDGGGSCHLQAGDKIYKNSTRRNASWLLIYMNNSLKMKFIELMLKQIGKKYVWGANGEFGTPKLLNRLISWFGIKYYVNSSFDAHNNVDKEDPEEVFDCSGLFVYCLRKLGIIKSTQDYTANRLYSMCMDIDKTELQDGDWLFRTNSKGHIVHIGMYYNGLSLHAKGTAYGVVLNDEVDTFNKFGRYPF